MAQGDKNVIFLFRFDFNDKENDFDWFCHRKIANLNIFGFTSTPSQNDTQKIRLVSAVAVSKLEWFGGTSHYMWFSTGNGNGHGSAITNDRNMINLTALEFDFGLIFFALFFNLITFHSRARAQQLLCVVIRLECTRESGNRIGRRLLLSFFLFVSFFVVQNGFSCIIVVASPAMNWCDGINDCFFYRRVDYEPFRIEWKIEEMNSFDGCDIARHVTLAEKWIEQNENDRNQNIFSTFGKMSRLPFTVIVVAIQRINDTNKITRRIGCVVTLFVIKKRMQEIKTDKTKRI